LLNSINRLYTDSPARTQFHRFSLALLAPLADRVGSAAGPNESANVTILRSSLMEAQANFGDAAVLALARKRFENEEGTSAEKRSALSIVAAHADVPGFDALLARAEKTADPLEKQHLFFALADIFDPALARRVVEVALTDKVPAGMGPNMIANLARKHPDLVWEMIAPRLDDPTLTFDKSTRWDLAIAIAGSSANPQRIADLEAYESRSVPAEARKPFLAATAAIQHNQRFVTQVLPEMDGWIATHAPAPSRDQTRASSRNAF